MLKFKLNVAERKTLAKRMEELTGIHPYYTKAPLYSYDIGSYTIDRNGNLLVEPENADAELLTTLLNEGLIRGGETIESTDDQMQNTEPTDHLEEDPVTEDTEAETEVLDEQESEDESTTEGNEPAEAESEEASEPDNAAEDEPDAEEPESEEQSEAEDQPEEVPLDLELAFPVSQHNGVTLRNLVNLLYSRGKLIGKATGGHFHVEEGLVEKLKDDSCTFAIMNFINAVSDYEAEHGAALEGLKITTEKVIFTGFPTASDHEHLTAFAQLAVLMNQQLPVWNLNGNRMKKAKPCIAYVMHEDRRLGCPDAEYFELLQGGYSDWEFPLDTLKRGLAASIGRAEAIRYLKKRQMM